MPTFDEYIASLSAAGSINVVTDKLIILPSGGTAKVCNPDDLSSGGGITALTGDVTASGTGSVAATIANNAVTTAKINDAAVTNAKVATGIDAAKLADGSVSNAEFQYLNGVTSAIQTQLDGKAPVSTVKKYVALLSQSGTDAPTATVLENTLGGTVVWTRNDVGSYTATLVGAFVSSKTTATCSQTSFGIVVTSRDNNDEVSITTLDTSMADADGQLNESTIEIHVYP